MVSIIVPLLLILTLALVFGVLWLSAGSAALAELGRLLASADAQPLAFVQPALTLMLLGLTPGYVAWILWQRNRERRAVLALIDTEPLSEAPGQLDILEQAKASQGRLSAVSVALSKQIGLEAGKALCETLVEQGMAYRESHEPGCLVYLFPDFLPAEPVPVPQSLAAPPKRPPRPMNEQTSQELSLLRLAAARHGRLSCGETALALRLSPEKGRELLERMVVQGAARIEPNARAGLTYVFPDLADPAGT